MLEKKEEHLTKKIDDETAKAKNNATTNKRGELALSKEVCFEGMLMLLADFAVALAALRQKKVYESELDKLAGRRLTLETQVRNDKLF